MTSSTSSSADWVVGVIWERTLFTSESTHHHIYSIHDEDDDDDDDDDDDGNDDKKLSLKKHR